MESTFARAHGGQKNTSKQVGGADVVRALPRGKAGNVDSREDLGLGQVSSPQAGGTAPLLSPPSPLPSSVCHEQWKEEKSLWGISPAHHCKGGCRKMALAARGDLCYGLQRHLWMPVTW